MSRIDEKRDLVTTKGILQYATSDLINEVAKYPVLWDRLHPEFKDGKAKEIVWHEINRVFVPFYDSLREEEKASITNILKTRWRNCISGLMNSVSQKHKNDRLFRPFKYAREMKFYLESRGVNFSDIYDSDHIDGIEDPVIKTESEEEEVQPEPDDAVEQYTPKNKKAKTLNTTPTTYRSSRLREKQMNLASKSAEKQSTISPKQKVPQDKRRSTSLGNASKVKKTTVNNSTLINSQRVQQQQIKRTPTSINSSINNSVDNISNTNEDIMESAGEEHVEEAVSIHYPEQQIYPRENPVYVSQVSKPKTVLNETEAADQAFFESIKPALRKMNEAQKLDFQIDVLQMLKTFQTN